MAAQNVAELVPRIRRAVEGPRSPSTGGYTAEELTAIAADAIADLILVSGGDWEHQLNISARESESNAPTAWEVDPALTPDEESLVAIQASLTALFHVAVGMKTSERIKEEGREWEYSVSANVIRDRIMGLQEERKLALAALAAEHPTFVRAVSLLEVRDAAGAALLEPWTTGAGRGGQPLL